jgi:hypothetical protein
MVQGRLTFRGFTCFRLVSPAQPEERQVKMETANLNKPILKKLKDLFVELQTPYNSLLSKQRKLEQRCAGESRSEKQKEAEAEQERLKREAAKRAAAGAAAAGLGSSYYGPSNVTAPENDNPIMSQDYKPLQLLKQIQRDDEIRRLAEQKYLTRASKYERRFSGVRQELQQIAKKIHHTLTRTVRSAFETRDEAKGTLLATDWRRIRDDLALNSIMLFRLPSSPDRAIDALEIIEADTALETQEPTQPKSTAASGEKVIMSYDDIQKDLTLWTNFLRHIKKDVSSGETRNYGNVLNGLKRLAEPIVSLRNKQKEETILRASNHLDDSRKELQDIVSDPLNEPTTWVKVTNRLDDLIDELDGLSALLAEASQSPSEKEKGGQPIEGRGGEKERKTKITKEEANVRVRELLTKTPSWDWTTRKLAKQINCSPTTVSKTPAYRVYNEKRKELRRAGTIDTVSISKELEAVLGTGEKDEVLKQLIADQEKDQRQDARQPKLYLSQEKRPERGRL